MTAFWLLAGLMAVLALAFIALPLLRKRQHQTIDRDQLNVAVIREQLAELKADMEAGKLEEAAFEAARHDLERELLDAVDGRKDTAPATTTRRGRWLLVILVPAVPVLAIMLYLQLGMSDFEERAARASAAQNQAGGMSEHDINLMLEKLAERLRAEPEHPEGWMLLGRTYTTLQRFDEAVEAYEQARKYGGDSPELLIDYADTLIAAQGGNFSDKAGELLKQALEQQPDNPKGQWLMGHWYFQRGDFRNALEAWQRVVPMVQPGSDNARILQQQIQIARARLGDAAPPESTPAPPAADGASIQVSVSLDPALRDSVSPDDTVFIFARAVSGPRMPLAIVRKQVRDLPVTVTLDDSLSMMPAMTLSKFPQVVVGARVSKTGQAMAAPGDLQGLKSPVATNAGPDARVEIVINERVGG